MPQVTPGVALLLHQVSMVAALRGWGRDKTIEKLKDAINVLNGEDAPPHSTRGQAEPPLDPKDKALLDQAEQWLKPPSTD